MLSCQHWPCDALMSNTYCVYQLNKAELRFTGMSTVLKRKPEGWTSRLRIESRRVQKPVVNYTKWSLQQRFGLSLYGISWACQHSHAPAFTVRGSFYDYLPLHRWWTLDSIKTVSHKPDLKAKNIIRLSAAPHSGITRSTHCFLSPQSRSH